MFGFTAVNRTIKAIDNYLDYLDECSLVFKSGVKNYLEGNTAEFNDNLKSITNLESTTTDLRRTIENELYSQAMVTDNRVGILQLLERLDNIVKILYQNLCQFEIEVPFIPSELNTDFTKLVELSTLSVECIVPASKACFRTPQLITEKIHRIYFYEKETSKLAQTIKRHVFHDMDNLKLSQKFHLRYFTLHIEELAEEAVKGGDLLSVMAIKLNA
jgi:uncharacterized protein Yka (UPF0111/DUF47 family)